MLQTESEVKEVNPDNMQTLPVESVESQWRLCVTPSETSEHGQETEETGKVEGEKAKGSKVQKVEKKQQVEKAKTNQKTDQAKKSTSETNSYQATLRDMPAVVWTTRGQTKEEPNNEVPSVAIEALDSEEEKEKGQAFKDFPVTYQHMYPLYLWNLYHLCLHI